MQANTNTLICPFCGAKNHADYTVCCNLECGRTKPPAPALRSSNVVMPRPPTPEKKIPAGICGILLGAFGVHKFILGYTKEGVIMLAISLLGSWLVFPTAIMGIVGLIEGIIYLTKPDQEFVDTYVVHKKGWM